MLNPVPKEYQKGYCGCNPNPTDSRDITLGDIAYFPDKNCPSFEEGFDVEKSTRIRFKREHQGSSSSCVGNGWAKYAEVIDIIEMIENSFVREYGRKPNRQEFYEFAKLETTNKEVLQLLKDLSAKDIYSQIYLLPDGGCVDKNTEILTTNGWKEYSEIKKDDKYFTINLKTHTIEIQSSTAMTIYNFNGEMIRLKGQNIDALLTPEHRCIVEKRTGYYKGNKCILSKDKKWKIIQAQNLKLSHSLPIRTDGYKNNKKHKYSDDMVSLIGWIITEGWFDGPKYGRNRTRIRIYQNEGKKADRIECLLKRLQFNYSIMKRLGQGYNGAKIKHNKKKITFTIKSPNGKEIRKILPDKILKLSFLLELNRHQMELLFDTMIDGDGCRYNRNGYNTEICFVQKNKETIENFGILCLLLGYNFTVRKVNGARVVKVKISRKARRFQINKINYNGIVWCPTVKNGTIFIRRNGIVGLTGQSYIRDGAGVVVNKGVCEETFIPSYPEKTRYNTGNPDEDFMREKKQTPESIKNALTYKSRKYVALPTLFPMTEQNWEDVRQIIWQFGGFVSGYGRHCIYFCGYGIDPNNGLRYIKYINSYGDDFGEDGTGKWFENYGQPLFNITFLYDQPNITSMTQEKKNLIINIHHELLCRAATEQEIQSFSDKSEKTIREQVGASDERKQLIRIVNFARTFKLINSA